MRTQVIETLATAVAVSYSWENLLDVRKTLFDFTVLFGFSKWDSLELFFKALEIKQRLAMDSHPAKPPGWSQ